MQNCKNEWENEDKINCLKENIIIAKLLMQAGKAVSVFLMLV